MTVTTFLELLATAFSVMGSLWLFFKYIFKSEFNEGISELKNTLNNLNLTVSKLDSVLNNTISEVNDLKSDIQNLKNGQNESDMQIELIKQEIRFRQNEE